jgi:hypothetical protein
MGHRTLSLRLVLAALFLDGDAYDHLRDDDNPFIEGLFLVVAIGVGTALLAFVGRLLTWASSPPLEAIKQAVWTGLQQMSWWPGMAASPAALAAFQRNWDLGWQIFPRLFGAPDPAGAALNILIWPIAGVVGWLIYGALSHLFARWLGGSGSFNQTLGVTALAYTPCLLRGLGVVPFLVIGGVVSTWQLICRYKAVRSVHRLSWGRSFWATVLPLAAYALVWIVVSAIVAIAIAAIVGRSA